MAVPFAPCPSHIGQSLEEALMNFVLLLVVGAAAGFLAQPG